jgi:hypothetical protein
MWDSSFAQQQLQDDPAKLKNLTSNIDQWVIGIILTIDKKGGFPLGTIIKIAGVKNFPESPSLVLIPFVHVFRSNSGHHLPK